LDGAVMVSERNLIKGLQQGDDEAFDRLLSQQGARVYGMALRMMHCPEEARDISQEVFVAVFLKAHQIHGHGCLAGWIHRIARNRVLNRLRTLARRRTFEPLSTDALSLEAQGVSTVSPFPRPDQALERQELLAFTQHALDSLDPDQREVLTLYHVHGLSYDAIAARVEVPIGTIKSRVSRARDTLKHRLHQWRLDEQGSQARVA
jgi:RNA polymerase sigma-70 factor (ECF subfamily)